MANLSDLQNAVGGARLVKCGDSFDGDAPLGRVVIDSRQVEPGDVFWGLRGDRSDGSDYAEEAFARGAAGAVVSRPVRAPGGCWTLVVEDTLHALHAWAAWHRRRFSGAVIGVTGSVGKTTCRQMIQTILSSKYCGTCSPRNYNNHIGLPMSMLQMEPDHNFAVLEMGASGPGEIARLAALCRPTIGVITHVGDAHLGGFGSRRQIADAKAELLDALPADGYAVLGEDPWLVRLRDRSAASTVMVGRGRDCDLIAKEVVLGQGTLSYIVRDVSFEVPVWGRHHLTAAMAATAVGLRLGCTLQETADALRTFRTVPMRCEVIQVRSATIINDTYNASPTSMLAALELVRDFDTRGRRIVVLGDMQELGDEAIAMHRQLGGQAVSRCGADLLIACGEYAAYVVAGAREAGLTAGRSLACRQPEETLSHLGQTILPGDVVLVKGSRALGMERIVQAMQTYPQRRVA
ncbi:MAG: UDP-N-acetylmuramoyl-tripeptide--D-alanyl-D-alanine ligase [Planctomycetaceae bacterium]|nr:UDP-N-acetylmuramoyl-tripeptide--D-alanyl-D-alanine ligase [Planctomycetaceae bacterium]